MGVGGKVGKIDKRGQKVQTSSHKISQGYNVEHVTIVKNTVLHIRNLLRKRIDLKISHPKEKK